MRPMNRRRDSGKPEPWCEIILGALLVLVLINIPVLVLTWAVARR